ncbi:MAG: SUF system NifU family Fe-S cluster assembly protein [Ignavibacteriales bacterium]|nr:Zinc-dependent sulfurtransferase SufU [Ignavibacteriaceae bacterium]MCK6614868.1 SUF system NifU family Fe-S cluster assembly protein [Ignavibacteriaceae bacterium]QOJ30020.1 MAG: SUF system NifU family Fe-S cluster assembly protein [Ignavibacteriales bacterium]
MNPELRELYQQVILDHYKDPRNYKILPFYTNHAEGHNPLCGDQVEIFLSVEDGIIKDISFQGNGCAISKSSASLMTAFVKGRTVEEVQKDFDRFHALVMGNTVTDSDREQLGKLAVLEGVKEFPMRVKCASLAWHTLIAAIKNEQEKVITE